MKYFARLDEKKGIKQPLKEHLEAVAEIARVAVPPTIRFPDISVKEIKTIIARISFFHDFGKYTDYFQDYLLHGIESELKSHAHISACFLHPIILNLVPSDLKIEHRYVWAFLCYLVVRQHHGHLSLHNLFYQEEMWTGLSKQAENILLNGERVFEDLELQHFMDFEHFKELLQINQLKNNKRYFIFMPQHLKNRKGIKDVQWYFVLIYLFSVLIDSDKLNSAQLERRCVINISPKQVLLYLQNKHGITKEMEINNRRNEVRDTMYTVINSLTKEQVESHFIYTVTAPTGIGKTLSALHAALRLQERIKQFEGYTPRIITAIPFINIIEQTKKDYEGVFGERIKLITHHRFTDFTDKRSVYDEKKSLDQSLLEVESWEADVVLTTFVQLFQSLLTGENRLLKKVNKFAGSIVNLDEIQAIPEQYMALIGALLHKVSSFFGTRFILMTATQPKVLELGELLLGSPQVRPIELLSEHERYFEDLNRTKLVPLLEKNSSCEEFILLFLQLWNKEQSALIVVNFDDI